MNISIKAILVTLAMAVQLSFSNSANGQESSLKRFWNRIGGHSRPVASHSTVAQAPSTSTVYAQPSAAYAQIPTSTPQAAGSSDPYGFAAIINRYRAGVGLPPLAYCETLSAFASQNNSEMCRKGLGHHILADSFQNCGWNYADAPSAAQGWMNSPDHRANMLNPNIRKFGIAYGPGPYWTLNAQ